MKDTFALCLLVLLSAQITKVDSQGYPPNSDGECRDKSTEYLAEDTKLCCKKCPPGERLVHNCNETAKRVCEPCPKDQYMEGINYAKTCFTCPKCKENKGLRYAQTCTATRKSKCECQPGRYCIMGFDNPYCAECIKHQRCKAGYGVTAEGTASSNVRCAPCPDGTFSDTVSTTDRCRPHKNCHGRLVVRNGSATSDAVCGPVDPAAATVSKTPIKESVSTTARTKMTVMTEISNIEAPQGTDSTPSVTMDLSETEVDESLAIQAFDTELAAITSASGLIFLVIIILLVCLYRKFNKQDAARLHPKVDANGNCAASDKINEAYLGATQLTSFTETSVEQECLLEKGEACSDQSQSSSNTESLTRTEGCSSEESIGPLQPTVPLHYPHSDLSEPLPLVSHTEPDTPHTSFQTQLSSQPTSPQIISPVTPSPQVNVNITFNIGNGTAGTPSVIPADLLQADCKLPFGEEEESFSIPQQEAGKQSIMSEKETECYSA